MPRTTALLGLTALLALAGTAFADNEMRLIDEERELYRATFDGGTLTDFVEMLQEGLEGRVMFIAPERGHEISMPKFDIANVDASHVISLAQAIANVPVVEVYSELAIDIGLGEGVPVFVFETSEVLSPLQQRYRPDTIEELRFPGGTVRAYVEALKEAGAEGRIVITGDDRDVPMQPVTLRNVTLESAVELLDDITDADASRMTRLSVSQNNGLYRVHVQTNARTSETKRASRVWSLRHITSQGLDDDTLLAAIEAGAETLDDVNQPTLRYHEPTSLLIANGTADALGLIDAIIGGLTDSASVNTEAPSALDAMRAQLDVLQREIERRVARIEATRLRMIEREVEIEQTVVDLQRAQSEADAARAHSLSNRMVTLRASSEALARSIDALDSSKETIHMLHAQLGSLIREVEAGTREPLTPRVLEQEFGLNSRTTITTAPERFRDGVR